MSEPRPLYLSVGSPTDSFETLEIRPYGGLVLIKSPGIAILAPQEARAAIVQLQAILDWLAERDGANGLSCGPANVVS